MIVRSSARAATTTDWLDSRHSFAYGSSASPDTHFGLLLVHNEDRLAPGTGFGEHPHRDVEVLTWVLAGSLSHTDDAGHAGVARPGVVQRMSAGTGVRHAEHAGPDGAHYLQLWLRPASPGAPAYDLVDVADGLASGRVVSVGPVRQPDATLHAVRLVPGGTAALPGGAYLHLFVARGTVRVGADRLGPGDAARLTDAPPPIVTAETGAEVVAVRMRTGPPVG